MITTFFKYLNYSTYLVQGFYKVQHGNNICYVSEYKDRNKGKSEIIESLKLQSNTDLSESDFHFHHIVEDQHLADIIFSHQLIFNYENMPAVMLQKVEHNHFHSRFDVGETRMLYFRDQVQLYNKQRLSKLDKKHSAIKSFGQGLNYNGIWEIRNRIEILKDLYKHAYKENGVLTAIAANIFDEYRNQLVRSLRGSVRKRLLIDEYKSFK